MRKPLNAYEQRQIERLLANEARRGQPPARRTKRGNLNRVITGIYACCFRSDEERQYFSALAEAMFQDLAPTTDLERLQIQYVVLLHIQVLRALVEERVATAERLNRDYIGHLRLLRATKRAREGNGPSPRRLTADAWAAELLDRVRQRHPETMAPLPLTQAGEESPLR